MLLCRDTPDGIETFMVVRHEQIDFASGALVFPGGKVTDEDGSDAIRERCHGVESGDDFIAYKVGAIREAFEESGILLARVAGSGEFISGDRLEGLKHYRETLASGETSLLEFLQSEDLTLACDCLHRFAHWVTPEMMPKRFDTHFFIATAPHTQVAAHDGSESVDSVWITPERVLAEADQGKWTVIFPTRLNLLVLGQSETMVKAVAEARNRKIVTVMPWMEKRDGETFLCIPPEAGYPFSTTKMP